MLKTAVVFCMCPLTPCGLMGDSLLGKALIPSAVTCILSEEVHTIFLWHRCGRSKLAPKCVSFCYSREVEIPGLRNP